MRSVRRSNGSMSREISSKTGYLKCLSPAKYKFMLLYVRRDEFKSMNSLESRIISFCAFSMIFLISCVSPNGEDTSLWSSMTASSVSVSFWSIISGIDDGVNSDAIILAMVDGASSTNLLRIWSKSKMFNTSCSNLQHSFEKVTTAYLTAVSSLWRIWRHFIAIQYLHIITAHIAYRFINAPEIQT